MIYPFISYPTQARLTSHSSFQIQHLAHETVLLRPLFKARKIRHDLLPTCPWDICRLTSNQTLVSVFLLVSPACHQGVLVWYSRAIDVIKDIPESSHRLLHRIAIPDLIRVIRRGDLHPAQCAQSGRYITPSHILSRVQNLFACVLKINM